MPANTSQLGPADLFLEAPACVDGDQIEFGCRLHEAGGTRRRIWFRFPAATASTLTRRADPFVIATFIYAMKRIDCLRVHGPISEGLVPNLAEFESAYAAFHGLPRRGPVQIVTSGSFADQRPTPRRRGLTAFSGGVDSCFSVFRHSTISDLRPKRPIAAALIMHGFDIPLGQPEVFARAAERARKLTDDAGIKLFSGATNLRILPEPWEDTFATGVAAALSFFQPAFAFGLIPSFQEWTRARLDHGSNPVTDPLLSSESFGIVHDGAGYSRIEKLRQLTRWPAALQHLRVCWEGPQLDRNCGQCEKCLRTILMLKLCGVTESPAFPSAFDPRLLDRLVIRNQSGLDDFGALIAEAHRLGLRESWVGHAERALRRNQRATRLWRRGRSFAALLPGPWREALRRAGHRWVWRERRAVGGLTTLKSTTDATAETAPKPFPADRTT
jgi:hypothetical protein